MPLYEFRCEDCNHLFERLCRQNKQDSVQCPQCGKDAKRIISAFRTGSSSGADGMGSGGGACGPCSSSSCGTCS